MSSPQSPSLPFSAQMDNSGFAVVYVKEALEAAQTWTDMKRQGHFSPASEESLEANVLLPCRRDWISAVSSCQKLAVQPSPEAEALGLAVAHRLSCSCSMREASKGQRLWVLQLLVPPPKCTIVSEPFPLVHIPSLSDCRRYDHKLQSGLNKIANEWSMDPSPILCLFFPRSPGH